MAFAEVSACIHVLVSGTVCVARTGNAGVIVRRVWGESRATETAVGVVDVLQVVRPVKGGAVVAHSVSAVAVAGARNAHRVVVVVVPAVLARAVGDPEGGVGGAHARVGAVVRRVVEAPVAGLAAGTGKTGFVGAEDAVVAAYTLTVEDVGGPRAVRDAVVGTREAIASMAEKVISTFFTRR